MFEYSFARVFPEENRDREDRQISNIRVRLPVNLILSGRKDRRGRMEGGEKEGRSVNLIVPLDGL